MLRLYNIVRPFVTRPLASSNTFYILVQYCLHLQMLLVMVPYSHFSNNVANESKVFFRAEARISLVHFLTCPPRFGNFLSMDLPPYDT